jgi:glyoxylase I family protein
MTTPPGNCGCPPTRVTGGVHHVIVNVTDLARAREFYGWLLPRLGYPGVTHHDRGSGWYGDTGSFWVKQAAAREIFDKDRVGLCEIAFRAGRRAEVDALAAALVARGAHVLDPPREYDYTRGYYAVFFTDPDGIKLELAHIPS